jgi:hypothetical protein
MRHEIVFNYTYVEIIGNERVAFPSCGAKHKSGDVIGWNGAERINIFEKRKSPSAVVCRGLFSVDLDVILAATFCNHFATTKLQVLK